MVTVIFYEKPGCINNTRQKALLKAAGHEVLSRNLLTEPWTAERLRLFFGELPVTEWFNRSAPQIKSGEVVPEQLDAERALMLMMKEPLLIRRPLIQISDRREIGFDMELIDRWVGLAPVDESHKAISENLMSQDLQTCPRNHEA